jgi:hypothetical protein
MTVDRLMHPGAGRPVKHPGRNLEPTVRIGTAPITAKNDAVRLLDSLVNADPKTKSWMPWVQHFTKLGSVGVPKSLYTMLNAGTRQSAI